MGIWEQAFRRSRFGEAISVSMRFRFGWQPERLLSAADRAKQNALKKAGAFIRTTARHSIVRAPYATRKPRGRQRTDFRRKVSLPGHPPYSRTGLLKRLILFRREGDSVLVGPVRLSKVGDAPHALEYGLSLIHI